MSSPFHSPSLTSCFIISLSWCGAITLYYQLVSLFHHVPSIILCHIVPRVFPIVSPWSHAFIPHGATLGHLFLRLLESERSCQSGESNPCLSNRSQTLYHYSVEPQVKAKGNQLARILILLLPTGGSTCPFVSPNSVVVQTSRGL